MSNIFRNIRQIIKSLLPHGYVLWRKKNRFLEDYDAWKKAGVRTAFPEQSHFPVIVSVDGFGASGSSAAMDLLREYDDCEVWATKPAFAKGNVKCDGLGEMDLVRHTGGLLFLEPYITDPAYSNDFWQDFAAKAFIGLVNTMEVYHNHTELRPYFYEFFDRIISQRLSCDRPLLNRYINPHTNITDIFTFRQMTAEEYHRLCRGFLYGIFNTLFAESKARVLVLDHIFGDCGLDMSRFAAYLPEIKRIMVKRDIRDVFVTANKSKYLWMAWQDADSFVEWERKAYRGYDENDESYLTLRFEDMVSDYDAQVARVEAYLGLGAEHHVKRQQIFAPERSKGNIGTWKGNNLCEQSCREIKQKAPELCYGE